MEMVTANRFSAYSLRVFCIALALTAPSAWASFVRWDLSPDNFNPASQGDTESGPTFSQLPTAPISGSISFSGTSMASGPSGQGTTTITFGSNWSSVFGRGTYSNIPFMTPTAFNNFSFTGDGTSVSLTAPVPSLWSLSSGGNSYSFDLLSLTDGHTEQGDMAVTGSGVLHATGYADTNYAGKAEAALGELKTKDFVYIHVGAADEASHQGDLQGKVKAIETQPLDATLAAGIRTGDVGGTAGDVPVASLPMRTGATKIVSHEI